MKRVGWIATFMLSLAATSPTAEESRAALRFTNPSGARETLSPASVALFWRADCAPCRQELEALPHIALENPDVKFALISLQSTESVSPHRGLLPTNVRTLATQDDPKAVLSAFGNTRTLALPYSVMLNRNGGICASHYGLLSSLTVTAWRKDCL